MVSTWYNKMWYDHTVSALVTRWCVCPCSALWKSFSLLLSYSVVFRVLSDRMATSGYIMLASTNKKQSFKWDSAVAKILFPRILTMIRFLQVVVQVRPILSMYKNKYQSSKQFCQKCGVPLHPGITSHPKTIQELSVCAR